MAAPPPPGIPPPPKPPSHRHTLADLRKKRPELLNLEEISRFDNYLIFAQSIVEGYFTGKHKSRYFGSSAEFADYREFMPGDDPGKLDWRVYGRTRRLYIRQYEEETDMVVYLMVDTSGSMNYARTGAESKAVHASRIAAALAYLMINQGDKVALTLFDNRVRQHLPPGGTRAHLFKTISTLEAISPIRSTGIENALHECTALFRKRGRIVILSDFFSDLDSLMDAISQFVHRRFEVLLLQVVDDDELNLPQLDNAQFVDMENGERIQVEPGEIRRIYRQRVRDFIDDLSRHAHLRKVRHSLVESRHSYLQAIEAYLGFRQAHSPRRRR